MPYKYELQEKTSAIKSHIGCFISLYFIHDIIPISLPIEWSK